MHMLQYRAIVLLGTPTRVNPWPLL